MCKKMKLDHQLTPYTKINSRWIKDLNISCDTIKVLEENIGRKISDIPCSNILTDMSPKARDIKERKIKWDLIKIKSFCNAKENSIKIQREPTVWENIFANDTSDKCLISKIYKELTQLHSRKTNNPIKNGQENQDGGVGRYTAPPRTTRTDRKLNGKEVRHQVDKKKDTSRPEGGAEMGTWAERTLIAMAGPRLAECGWNRAGSLTTSRPCGPTFAHR